MSKLTSTVVAFTGLISLSAHATLDGPRDRHLTPTVDSQTFGEVYEAETRKFQPKESLVNKFIRDALGVKDVSRLNLGLALRADVVGTTKEIILENGAFSEEQRKQLISYFSDQSEQALIEILRALGRTQYSNSMIIGEAGVGKSFLLSQITSMLSFGVVSESLATKLGLNVKGENGAAFKALLDAFISNTDLILINHDLLSQDNTEEGKPFPSEDLRMRSVLSELFRTAEKEFQRSGRRTLFIADEVATLPEMVQQMLKKLLDKTGYPNGGYSILEMTTPEEYQAMVDGDSAIERRTKKILIPEPTEAQALNILVAKAAYWEKVYGLTIDIESLEYIVHMRKTFNSPPLAMPASVLAATNDLFLWKLGRKSNEGVTKDAHIALREAQEFVIERAGLSKIWLHGPNGEPPLHDLAESVKAYVVDQDALIEDVADSYATYARLGGKVPVYIFMGPSGSGKDTTHNALNTVLFGDERGDLMFSLAGSKGFKVESILEGPPLGNHSDNKGGSVGAIAKALASKPHGNIAFNEVKDLPSDEFDKFKVLTDKGVIKGTGRDTRPRPLLYNALVFISQHGEELTAGKTDEEIERLRNTVTEDELVQILMAGDPKTGRGKVPWALIQRARASGGIHFVWPVRKSKYAEIVRKVHLNLNILPRLKARNQITAEVDESLVQLIAKTAIGMNQDPRVLLSITTSFVERAISKAMDAGLPQREITIKLKYERDEKAGKHFVVIENVKDGKFWKQDVETLHRFYGVNCAELLK